MGRGAPGSLLTAFCFSVASSFAKTGLLTFGGGVGGGARAVCGPEPAGGGGVRAAAAAAGWANLGGGRAAAGAQRASVRRSACVLAPCWRAAAVCRGDRTTTNSSSQPCTRCLGSSQTCGPWRALSPGRRAWVHYQRRVFCSSRAILPPTPGQVRLHFTGKGKKPRDAEQLSKSHSSQGRSVRLGASRSDSEGRVPGAPWAPGHRDTQQGPGPFADRAAWEQVTAAGSQVGLVTPDDPGLRETAQNRGGGARLAGQQKGALSRMGRALSLQQREQNVRTPHLRATP